MSEENDILFQIDMELYDEFNDKFCEMNEHLGDFYCYKDIDDLEKIRKDTEIELLRKAIAKLQKEIKELTTNQLDIKDKCIGIAKKLEENGKTQVAEYILAQIGTCPVWDCGEPYCNYISKQKIKQKIKEMKEANYYLYKMGINRTTEEGFALKSIIETLEELLEEED